MTRLREPESGADRGSTPDPLEAGLRIGFGRPDARPEDSGASVLVALEAAAGRLPRLRLREDGEAEDSLEVAEASVAPEIPKGTGRYQVAGELARGGVGAVLKGRDLDLGRDVAMKVLLEEHAGSSRLLHRFVEEAQIGGQLQHPGVVPVYEMGLRPDRRPYFTMKLVKGKTLAALLENRIDAAEERPRFLGIFRQVLQTMAYAHARGVVHRDLKPANIMVGAFGEVLVMDWGLAKVLARGGVADEPRPEASAVIETVRTGQPGTQSLAGSILGTPAYMPPEQARGEVDRLDERADVFALGAMLTEILTGKPPYGGDSTAAVRKAAAEGRLEEAWSRLEGCGADPELVAIARACLAPRRRDRPRGAEMVADRFGAHLAAVEERARRAKLAAAAARARAVEEERARRLAESLARAEQRRRRLAVGLAVALLAVVVAAGGGLLWLEGDRHQREERRTASVRAAMTEAAEHRGRAAWSRAVAAAERAVKLAGEGDVHEAVAARARALLDRVRGEADAARGAVARAEREQELLARLEAIRGRTKDQSTPKEQVADYAAALGAFGIDVDALSIEEVARRIRETAIVVELVAALDDWSNYRGALRERGGVTQAALRKVVLAADPDPLRSALRRARYAKAPARVREHLATADVGSLPAATLTLFAPLLGDLAAEAAFLKQAHRRFPGDFWINYLLAKVHIQASSYWHPAAALPFSEAALALRPESAAAWGLHGNVLNAALDHEQAVVALRNAVSLRPEDHNYLIGLGLALMGKGELEEAVAVTRKAITFHEDCKVAHSNLGTILYRQVLAGKAVLDDALAALRDAARLWPESPDHPLEMMGELYMRAERFEEAVGAFQKAVELDSKNAWLHYRLGCAFVSDRKWKDALEPFRKAIDLGEDSPEAHFQLGRAYAESGQLKKAIKCYRTVVRKEPDRVDAQYNLGQALDSWGDLPGASSAYRAALDIDSEDALSLHNLGHLLCRLGKHKDALDCLQKASLNAPEWAFAWASLGWVYHNLGEFKRAVEVLKTARSLEPDLALARHRLDNSRRMMALEPKLAAVLRGQAPPAKAADMADLAWLAHLKRRYAASARLFAAAFEADAGPDRGVTLHYRDAAGCAAVLAGSGKGEDATTLEDGEAARWRRQALAWLRAELKHWKKRLAEHGEGARNEARSTLHRWRLQVGLEGVREKEALARLPAAERAAWQAFWSEVADTLKTVSE